MSRDADALCCRCTWVIFSFSPRASFLHADSDKLEEKKAETADLANQYKLADNDYNQKKSILKKLLNEAEAIAPKDEWHERLEHEDLPADLEGVEEALDEAEGKVNSITDNPHVMRQYEERKKEIANLQEQLDESAGEKDMYVMCCTVIFTGVVFIII